MLELDDGQVILQSNAILWYLAEGTPFLPGDRLGRAQVGQWLHFEQEWIMRGVGAPRFWTLTGRNPDGIAARVALGCQGLDILEDHLASREFAVGAGASIADLALFAYGHVAPDAGIDLSGWPAIGRWIDRIQALPRFMDDYIRYPGNARPGQSRSIYDAT